MVLSNKKLKQKLRSQLADSLVKSESQSNPSNLKDSQTHVSFKSLLNSISPKPILSKREIRRVKIPSLKEIPDLENGVEEKESEGGNGGLKKKKKDNKRKREVDVSEGKDLGEKKSGKKKKKKIKKKKKVVVKKDEEEEGVQEAKGESEEQVVEEASQIETQISKEDENVCTKIYVGGIPYYSTVDDIRSFFEGCGSITEIDCLKFPETGKFNGIAMISFRTEAASKRALALDGSDMGGLSLKIQPYKATRDKKVSDFAPAMLEGYNRIYVGNLSWDITEAELRKFFSDCSISSIRLGKDKETGEFKGFAHVDFADSLSLTMALKLDQKPIFGRPVRIRCAVPPKSVNPGSKAGPVIGKKEGSVKLVHTGGAVDAVVNDDVARKAKRQTCYECGEKGHLSSSCPNKKEADVARTDDVAVADVEGEDAGDGKVKRRTCYECGEKGHLSSSCPNKKAADVAHAGNRNADVAFDKDENEAENVGDGKLKRRTCYECGEKGHLSSSCPNKKAADGAHTGNRNADVVDTDENEAENIGDGKVKRRTCYECGEKGHLSSSCPNKKAADVAHAGDRADDMAYDQDNEAVDYNAVNSVSDGKLRRRTCYECGERGHLSSLCPKKQTADMASSKKEYADMAFEKADVAVANETNENAASSISEGKLRRRTCYECGERGHLSSLCPKKQTADVAVSNKEGTKRTADVAFSSKEDDDMAVEEVKTAASVSEGKLRRRTCYECGLKGHVSSLCPNK